jgi:hypothetical protein
LIFGPIPPMSPRPTGRTRRDGEITTPGAARALR